MYVYIYIYTHTYVLYRHINIYLGFAQDPPRVDGRQVLEAFLAACLFDVLIGC